MTINEQIEQIRHETVDFANTAGRIADAFQIIADMSAENADNLQLLAPTPWNKVPQDRLLVVDTGVMPRAGEITPFRVLFEVTSGESDYFHVPLVIEIKGVIKGNDMLMEFGSSINCLNLFNTIFNNQIDTDSFGYSLTEKTLKLYISTKVKNTSLRVKEVVQVNNGALPWSPVCRFTVVEYAEYIRFKSHFASNPNDYFALAITDKALQDAVFAYDNQDVDISHSGNVVIREGAGITTNVEGDERNLIRSTYDVGFESNTTVVGDEQDPLVLRSSERPIIAGAGEIALRSEIPIIPEPNVVDITGLFSVEDGTGNPIPLEFAKVFAKEILGNENNLVHLHFESFQPIEGVRIRPIAGYGLEFSRNQWVFKDDGEAVAMVINAETPDNPTVIDVPNGVASFDLTYSVGSEDSSGGASYYTRMVNGTSVATPFTIADRPIVPYMFSDVTDIIHINFGKDYEGTTALPENFLRGSSVQTLSMTGLANVTTIGSHAFAESNLLEYTFPVGLTTGGGSLFKDCINLRRVYYNARQASSVSTASTLIFEGCTALVDVYIGNEVVVIPSHLLRSTPAINVHFGDNPSLRQLNTAVFAGSAIRRLTLPASFNYFQGTDNFSGCRYLEEVVFLGNVTSIPTNTFRGCIALPKITLPASVTTLGTEAFYSCTNLVSVVFEGVITSSSTGVFAQCNSLSEIEIPTGLTKLPNSWLAFCYALKTLFIPKNITAIEYRALRSCTGLSYIVMESEEPPVLDAEAFTNASQFNIYVPDSAIDAYRAAPEWSNLQHRILPVSQLP